MIKGLFGMTSDDKKSRVHNQRAVIANDRLSFTGHAQFIEVLVKERKPRFVERRDPSQISVPAGTKRAQTNSVLFANPFPFEVVRRNDFLDFVVSSPNDGVVKIQFEDVFRFKFFVE